MPVSASRWLTAPGRWSVAAQTFALQVLVALLVVGRGHARLPTRRRSGPATQEATARATAVAETVASTPSVVAGGRAGGAPAAGAAGVRRGRPARDRHRLRGHHEPDRHPLHPPRPGPDRRTVPRAHRRRPGRRHGGRGLHRHARGRRAASSCPVDRRVAVGGRAGRGRHPQVRGERAPAEPAARAAARGPGGRPAVRARDGAGRPVASGARPTASASGSCARWSSTTTRCCTP